MAERLNRSVFIGGRCRFRTCDPVRVKDENEVQYRFDNTSHSKQRTERPIWVDYFGSPCKGFGVS